MEQGPAEADVLFVLDPAGLGRHGRLPATWRDIARSTHIAWLRLPATPAAMPRARDVLERLADSASTIDVLAEGTAAGPAMLLATDHPGQVRSVLLVDPEPCDAGLAAEQGASQLDQALLNLRSVPIEQVLTGHGVRVKVLDRGAEPVRLGHPRVVAEVAGELRGEHVPARARCTVKRPSVPGQVWQALRMRFRDRFARQR
ncbi:pimeloyl-ACP methyl ester carboxylesterase [Crossiella equi]|uniref:Pimeloyl-ACP methyl ester carboxylesterase n=1 Tax=Crossiella equi TaxID=130796 RepID=A0ABS5AID9_9PSEU|nr:hypothetical protein [Crossiella equi]MBP2476339.1 pimeloyl-ACP methyl ester carboxylesterase [Crossiella equi]